MSGGVRVRKMREADLDQVLEIAASLKDAPHWPHAAYVYALGRDSTPRRIALVAEIPAEESLALKGHGFSRAAWEEEKTSALAAGGEQEAKSTFPQGLKPGASADFSAAQLKPRPFKASAPFEGSDRVKASNAFKATFRFNAWRVVGFLVVKLVPPEAEVETIAVSAAEQRRGIGKIILSAMEKELRAAGVHEVLLEVRASNERAREFYGSQGWSETGRRARYYAEPEEDAVLMSLKLG